MNALSGLIIAAIIIVVIILILLIWVIATYNGFISLKNKCEEGYSTMDVYLKKRFDLIPNLVETVKGYAAHESGTLEKVTQARSMIQSATTPDQKFEGESQLTGALRSLFAVSESYPDLKANTNFLDLQNQLTGIEDEIAKARKFYNALVRMFNVKVQSVPSNIIAGLFHFTERPMFEVGSEEERVAPKVQF
ncbi:MAG: LemA family protein [Clostridiales Family XIII bacterium]|jgi:LemA protein|nr:LemA family protein [Clostridiales Family XIII bacterium]